jgi:hypothetical protein
MPKMGMTEIPENNPALARANFVEAWTRLIASSLKEFME